MSYKTSSTHIHLSSYNKVPMFLYLTKTPNPENRLIIIIPEINWSVLVEEDEIENLEAILINSFKNRILKEDIQNIVSTIGELYTLSSY